MEERDLEYGATSDLDASCLQTLGALLWARAQVEPSRAAYAFLSPEGQVVDSRTYAELSGRAARIAAVLRSRAAPADRVVLSFSPGLEFVDAFFACLFAGMVAVPVQPCRSKTALDQVARVAQDSGATLALSTAALSARLGEAMATVLTVPDALALSEDVSSEPPAEAGAESLAFLQYTSGSTGTPKGVMVTHGSILANSRAIHEAFGHSRASRGVIWLPAHHDMGLVGGIIQPLFGGFPVWLMSPLDFLQRPARWLQAISRYRATTSGGPNFAFELCTARVRPEVLAGVDLSAWEVAFCGAETVRPATLRAFSDRFAACGFRRRSFLPCYGLAEATLLATGRKQRAEPTTYEVDADALATGVVHAPGAGARARALASCGMPAEGHDVAIVASDAARRCGEDEVGEIWVSGPSVSAGYWTRPELSRAQFGARIEGESRVYLRTGDQGFLRAGELFVCGRIKDMIVVAGCNYAAEDIEAASVASHPAFLTTAAAAFSVDDGALEYLVVVQEVLRSSVGREPLELLVRAVREAVATAQGLPIREVRLVLEGALPRTSSGKVRRGVCRELYLADGLPELRAAPWRAVQERQPREVGP